MDHSIQTVAIIGAGNVAQHLAKGFMDNGIRISAVFSKSGDSAKALAIETGARLVNKLVDLPPVDLVLVCVSDAAVAEVLAEIPEEFQVAYTSGSVELQTLPHRENLGVFYPLQTFSKVKEVNLFEVPFLIEAVNEECAQALFNLAWKLSRNVRFASSEERKKLHLGAVFVNNFTNHLVFLAKEYLEQQGMDWELLKPLLKETFEKIQINGPYDAQTGPARRNDQVTIHEHLSMLKTNKKEIYDVISRSIGNTYNSNDNK